MKFLEIHLHDLAFLLCLTFIFSNFQREKGWKLGVPSDNFESLSSKCEKFSSCPWYEPARNSSFNQNKYIKKKLHLMKKHNKRINIHNIKVIFPHSVLELLQGKNPICSATNIYHTYIRISTIYFPIFDIDESIYGT